MKVYKEINGVTHEADAPDGALQLELRSRHDPSGSSDLLPPIEMIDRRAGTFRREGRAIESIPELTFTFGDLAWRPRP